MFLAQSREESAEDVEYSGFKVGTLHRHYRYLHAWCVL
jgi:hypothetical protein